MTEFPENEFLGEKDKELIEEIKDWIEHSCSGKVTVTLSDESSFLRKIYSFDFEDVTDQVMFKLKYIG